jgi:glycosyltransferase involved in cell wall biosynthesis
LPTPLVSIILPTRDRPLSLRRALASVLAQSEGDFEVIVVDNSVRAGALAEAAAELADTRVRVVATRARNAAEARNAGLGWATGEYVSFLDDDDAYRPDKIASQIALAIQTGSPLVLCGARFNMRGRSVVRHVSAPVVGDDELLLTAGLGTPFQLHRRGVRVRFDESLFAGEDHHYAHALLAEFNLRQVPVVQEPLVDVYQDASVENRTNLRADAGWQAARRIWWQFGDRFSRRARRLYVVRAGMARAKLRRQTGRVLRLMVPLLRRGGIGQLRFGCNALLVSTGWARGRWVT